MNKAMQRLWRFRRATTGVSAVEFAILMPMLMLLFFGGFAISTTVALSRKITITTRALADLTSQYKSTMAQTDMTTVMNASTQILAPYDSTPLVMRISEVTTDALLGTTATVTWSSSSGTALPPYKPGVAFKLPTGIFAAPNVSFIYAETSYVYTPPFGTTIIGKMNLGDDILMLPRKSTSISYTGS